MITRLDSLADRLDAAVRAARSTGQITADLPDFTLADAYAVQQGLIARRIARGERVVGIKMGFTSRAKALQMGVSDLIWGQLTDAMQIVDDGAVDLARFIHPRIEPEIAFRLRAPLSGIVDEAEARASIGAVAPALEIIDSRYENFKFALADVVADNSSSSAFVVGPWREPPADMADIAMSMRFDDVERHSGSTAAILGDPVQSLVAAARLAADVGIILQPGWIVLAGAATPAEPFTPDSHVTLHADGIGKVGVRATGGAA